MQEHNLAAGPNLPAAQEIGIYLELFGDHNEELDEMVGGHAGADVQLQDHNLAAGLHPDGKDRDHTSSGEDYTEPTKECVKSKWGDLDVDTELPSQHIDNPDQPKYVFSDSLWDNLQNYPDGAEEEFRQWSLARFGDKTPLFYEELGKLNEQMSDKYQQLLAESKPEKAKAGKPARLGKRRRQQNKWKANRSWWSSWQDYDWASPSRASWREA